MNINNDYTLSSDSENIIGRTLAEQMGITGNEIIERKNLLKFTKEHEKSLHECADFIHRITNDLVADFYAEQTKENEVALLIGDADSLTRLKNAMFGYIQSLFSGEYGQAYVSSRLRIGLVHKRIGVSPKLYLSGIQKLTELIEMAIIDFYSEAGGKNPDIALEAIRRLITFDIGLVFDTYIKSLTSEIKSGRDKMERHASSLELIVKERTQELEEQARHDPLTGLFNQRTFYESLNRDLSASKRYGQFISLIYMDLDGFKKLNDLEGHLAGDKLLKQLAVVIKNNLRDTDSAARYGGDEFCVILPNTSLLDATVFCQRLNTEFAAVAKNDAISISSGIAQSGPKIHLDSKSLVKAADKSMYKAKAQMGYAVIIDENLPPENIVEISEDDKTSTENKKKQDNNLEIVSSSAS